MTSVAMTASSKPMVSAIALAAKRFSSVPRWCTHHLVSRRFLHRAMERHNKPLCMNTAAPFGSVHFCHMRASSTASAPSAVGFDNYDHEVKNFKLHVPEYFNFASDVIDVWAEKQTEGKNKLAFWWIDDNRNELKWTFQQLSDLSKRTSNILLGPCQLTPGDRVVVILPRVPEWWLLNIASCRMGVVLIPGTTQLTPRDIRHRLLRSGAKCVITDAATANDVDQVIGDCPNVQTKLVVGNSANPRYGWLDFVQLFNAVKPRNKQVQTKSDDPLQIYFTSGTTGEPKMTQQTHSSYGLASLITGKYWLDLTPSDIHWNLSDTGWAKSAWSSVFAPWTQGACVFVHHSPKFTPQRVLQVLEKYPISTFCATPTAYRMLVLENFAKYNLSSIRHCVSAGEPLNPEVIDQWLDATGTVIREGYGQTETVLQCGSFRCLPNKPGSMGKPAPGMDVRVIGEDGLEVGSGIEGDIAIRVLPDRPVGLFSCYVDEPEKTASTYQGDYYLTGDRAYRDDDGYMWFVGRSDDIILSAGYRIGPFEVESALLEHPAVVESAVVSSPHTTRGEVVKAYVVLMTDYQNADKEALTSELQQLVKDITAPYKYPRKVEFVESLPKTISGKIRRIDLRNREWRKQQ